MYIANQQRINHLIISESAKLIGKAITTQEKIVGALKLLAKWAGLYYGRVLLPEYASNELQVAYHYGLDRHKLEAGKYTVPFDKGLSGFVWRSGQADLVINIKEESRFLRRIAEPLDGSLDNISFISIPIIAEGVTIGILSAQRSALQKRPYSCDVDLLKIIAAMFGPVLYHVQQRAQPYTYKQNQLDRKSVELMKLCESHGIIGHSKSMLDAVSKADNIRKSDAAVLLLGESGTGKEMFAQLIHKESRRKAGPYIAINCASIPESLLESELFGHEKGSFTGAVKQKIGKIQRAHGGTLFLDEIGDMPLDLQVKLLRVLQEKTIEPIGSNHPVPVDFRIITATNVNLKQSIEAGKFRLDLYFRLNVVPIYLPPLRERKGDIPRLVEHFMRKLNEVYDTKVSLTQGAIHLMEKCVWPGNIRQLENVLERALLNIESPWITEEVISKILSDEAMPEKSAIGTEGQAESQPVAVGNKSAPVVPDKARPNRPYQRLSHEEREVILGALKTAKGNQKRAAEMLDMTTRQFRYRLAMYTKETTQTDR